MAKRQLNKKEKPLSLKSLIPTYGELKFQVDEDKKTVDKLKDTIKGIMKKKNLDKKEVDGYIVNYSIRVSESYNEDTLIDIIKKHDNLKSCLKKKVYVDMEELESLIYNEKIPKKILLEIDKCRVKKESEYLTITKSKE